MRTPRTGGPTSYGPVVELVPSFPGVPSPPEVLDWLDRTASALGESVPLTLDFLLHQVDLLAIEADAREMVADTVRIFSEAA